MKEDRKRDYARRMEYSGKRVYGKRPKRRDRKIIFTPWALILKRRRQERRRGIVVGGE